MSQTDLPEGFGTAAATTRIDRIWSQVLEVTGRRLAARARIRDSAELAGTYLGVLAGMRSAAELAYA
jgi:hypothetical protein